MTHTNLTGLILAGGQSRRFGTDKARFVVDNRPMIAHVYEAVAQMAPTILVSTAPETAPYEVPGPARYVVDRYVEAGPLAGLHAGLAEADTPWVLAVACDMPCLTAAALRALAAARTADEDAVVAVTPDGQRHPLCACYHRRILPRVEAQLKAGRGAVHALLDRLAVGEVDLPAMPLCNVNTQLDVTALHS